VEVYHGDRVEGELSPENIKSILAAGEHTLWADMESPNDQDWKTLSELFGFHPLAIEDAQKQDQRAKVDEYEGYLFLSLRSWRGFQRDVDDIEDVTNEIDVFLGPNYFVTIHQTACPAVSETRRRWEQHPDKITKGPAYLLYELLDTIIDDFFPVIDHMDDDIDKLETIVYASAGSIDVGPALRLKRRLLLLRQTISPMRDVVNHLLRTDITLIPAGARVYFQDVYDHALRQVEQVDLHRDMLTGVLDALMAQTSNRLNQVMKTMTAVATILMSASLITGIYGMNFVNMPELHTKYGYFVTLAGMGLVAVGLTVYFRRIKWL
jgi:magnesium transporter